MSGKPDSLELNDHRSIGRRLRLFALDEEIGKGLPLWLPNGTIIRDELEKLARELEFQAGFERVVTPQIARSDLYRRSGHLPFFEDSMYPLMDVAEEGDGGGAPLKDSYALRPMNCPHHHRVFAAEPRSYRDLPLRLAEYGQVYRWERSGALSGLSRVRGMCMNDGHIYCQREKVRSEIGAVLGMYKQVYRLLGITSYRLRLSRHDPSDPRGKYANDPEAWAWAEALLADLLRELGLDYDDGLGHAAFYGPKIDIQVSTAAGGEETLSTVQLDFVQPGRMGLSYVGSDGQSKVPLCIHRAPFSTHERIVAYLSELYDGAFPTWLAPVQLLVIPVSGKYLGYAEEIVARFRAKFVRVKLARLSETVSRNVLEATQQRVPNSVVVGAREQAARSVTLRRLRVKEQVEIPVDALEESVLRAIRDRLV
jgi:threonyl-tRNA synthetase